MTKLLGELLFTHVPGLYVLNFMIWTLRGQKNSVLHDGSFCCSLIKLASRVNFYTLQQYIIKQFTSYKYIATLETLCRIQYIECINASLNKRINCSIETFMHISFVVSLSKINQWTSPKILRMYTFFFQLKIGRGLEKTNCLIWL